MRRSRRNCRYYRNRHFENYFPRFRLAATSLEYDSTYCYINVFSLGVDTWASLYRPQFPLPKLKPFAKDDVS